MEGRDVDLALAQQRAQPADEARLVVVGQVEHVRAELGLDLDALDLDDARMAAAEQGPRDRAGEFFGRHRDADDRVVVAVALVLDLGHVDAALISVLVSWPAKEPSLPARSRNGASLGASSAETLGMLSELVTAPVSR